MINGIGLNNDAISSDGKAIGSNGTDRALMNYLISLQEDSIDRSVIIEKEPLIRRRSFQKLSCRIALISRVRLISLLISAATI